MERESKRSVMFDSMTEMGKLLLKSKGIPDPDQIPKSQVVKDMISFIARMPLTDDQANLLYDAIRKRVPSKSCVRCQKLKCIGFEGSVVEWRGMGRQFICEPCQSILREKGQL